MPYSCVGQPDFLLQANSAQEWDLWGIGIIILEILVGTHLVSSASTCYDIRNLMTACEEWLDPQTGGLLNELLLVGYGGGIERYIEAHLDLHPAATGENIRRVQEAVIEVTVLQNLNKAATAFQKKHANKLYEQFKIKNKFFE